MSRVVDLIYLLSVIFSGFKEPDTVDDAPHVWPDETGEVPLQEARPEYVVDEAILIDAGANHGSDARRERDEVQDGTKFRVVTPERHNRVFAARWATTTTYEYPPGHLPIIFIKLLNLF